MNKDSPEKVMLNLQKSNPRQVKVVTMIRVTNAEGDGTPNHPVRLMNHYFTISGQQVAVVPYNGAFSDDEPSQASLPLE